MASETKGRQGANTTQSLIRKLTTEKAIKAYRQLAKETAATEDDITSIKLSGRGIKTIESLDLPNLRRLDLSRNNLNRLKGLQGCSQVTYLTAAGNELTGEGLDGVRPLRDLKVFNASSNRVRRIAPSVFAQFRQLQALVLNNNEISEVPPTWLKKGLLALNTLVLSHNEVKSLADAGLGRLTALTKLSVSHNRLSELPDLSACSALEELRAAHNLVSDVPSSLGKNVALRTLDLGHNNIEGWNGLERVGKNLTSLVQLTLAGNPLCGSASAGAQVPAPGADDGEGGGDEYVARARSLFPGLKVRDGKRILMKKSHTYYEQRAADGEAAGSANAASIGRGSRPAESSRRPRSGWAVKGAGGEVGCGQLELGETKARRCNGVGVSGVDDRQAGKTESGDAQEEERSKEKRRLKKAARKAREEAGKGGAGAKRARKMAAVDIQHRDVPNEDVAVEELKPNMKMPPCDTDDSEKIPAVPDEGRDVVEVANRTANGKAQKDGRKAKTKPSSKDRKMASGVSAGNGGGGDPYSSSDDLPIPKARRTKAIAGAVKKSSSGGDAESGVVAVVLNKKRKGASKGSKGKAWHGGAKPQTDDVGEGHGGGGGFCVEAMLQARGQREAVGLGSGVSAWD